MLSRRSVAAICMVYLVALLSIGWGQASRPLRTRIPKPNPEKIQNIMYLKDWKNPYLLVLRDGIEVVGVTHAGHPIAVESVAGVLESLPESAWPDGLVAAVQESWRDTAQIRANRTRLAELLRKGGITVDFWENG